MFDIAFLGCMFPKKDEASILKNSIGSVQNAANLLQWDYIQGIELSLNKPIYLLTCPSIGVYPYGYKKSYIKGHPIKRENGGMGEMIGFLNIPVIRQLTLTNRILSSLKKWASKTDGRKKVLIVYSHVYASAVYMLKKRYPDIAVYMVLLDLPQYTYMHRQSNVLYRLKKNHSQKMLNRVLHHSSGAAVITEQMAEALKLEIPSVVIEGMVQENVTSGKAEVSDLFHIVYTGTLTGTYGVMDAVRAVQSLNQTNIRLTICGSGENAKNIEAIAQQDPRIDYRGTVSAAEARAIQTSAQLLLNPRKNDVYTKYSFPSKILQYMSTGVPVLCYQLEGIPKEYDSHLIYVRPEESLADAIMRVYAMTTEERLSFGKAAAQYVVKEKRASVQAKKLLDLIKRTV